MVAHASAKGITRGGVESRYEGDIDLRGFMGISPEVKVGFSRFGFYFNIDEAFPTTRKKNSSAWRILAGVQHHCQPHHGLGAPGKTVIRGGHNSLSGEEPDGSDLAFAAPVQAGWG